MRLVYADNAATTRISDEVFDAMMPWLKERYGNASTLYRLGREADKAIESARQSIAKGLHADPMEIFFTSGGTESDNWALKGTLHHYAACGKTHLITSSIEHHAVLNCAKSLEKDGLTVTYLPVLPNGRIHPESVREALRPTTGLVSIMYANNETGVIQPIAEIGAICREAGVLFHTDAVQAAGVLQFDVQQEKIDMLSLSAHKFHGPKGIGVLYCRKKAIPDTYMHGGEQERGHRAGTENTAAIVGLAAAFEQARAEMHEKAPQIAQLRDHVETELLKIDGSHLNGTAPRLPGTLNIAFDGIDGQSLLMELDIRHIAASAGSACDSGSMTPSHVLKAMGVPYTLAHGSLRLSFGRYNTAEDAEIIIREVREAVELLRTHPVCMN